MKTLIHLYVCVMYKEWYKAREERVILLLPSLSSLRDIHT